MNQKCEHEGCNRLGVACQPCGYGEEAEPEPEYFCSDHAFDHGYCYACGGFWAGVEDFEFSRNRLCSNCRDDLDDDPIDEDDYCEFEDVA